MDRMGDGVSDARTEESQGGAWVGEGEKPAGNDKTTHVLTENKPAKDNDEEPASGDR